MRFRDEWIRPVEKTLDQLLFEAIYAPIISLVPEAKVRNSRAALLEALRAGRVSYDNGEFSGRFTAAISRELRRFASFDERSKTFRADTGSVPPDVLAVAVEARQEAVRLSEQIDREIGRLDERMESMLDDVILPINGAYDQMDAELSGELRSLGIKPEMSQEMREQITREYRDNMERNIKGWLPEQTGRLRDMVERHALKGYRRDELIKMIEGEWSTTHNKAKFWARQETHLFFAAVRDSRYQEAGVRRFRWSATMDKRTRTLHRNLHRNVYDYANPPIIDERTGERGTPGQAFGCRCTAIPLPS